MSTRIYKTIRSNVIGLVALFVALTGTAYAVDGSNPGTNTVGSQDIINQEVTQQDLGPDSVSGGKIQDNAVNTSAISNGQVKTLDIGKGAVLGDDIANGVVCGSDEVGSECPEKGEDDIADETISEADIEANAVESDEIQDGQVTNNDLSGNAVSTDKIQTGAVRGDDLAEFYNVTSTVDVAGGTGGNGIWNGDDATAQCNSGDQIMTWAAAWNNTSLNEALAIGESNFANGSRSVTVTGLNDSGTTRTLTVRALCLDA